MFLDYNNAILDQCTCGFPDVTSRTGSGLGHSNSVTTRLFPDMKFGCSGTVVRVSMAGEMRAGWQDPKIQIWRENNTHPDIYYKSGPDIKFENSVCLGNLNRNQRPQGVFHCILSEVAYVSVQTGDILGLELPPTDDDDFEPYFTSEGPMSYVFQQQLNSIVNLSEAHSVTNDLPQINLLVVLGNLLPTPNTHS